jgi:hypothetical protein
VKNRSELSSQNRARVHKSVTNAQHVLSSRGPLRLKQNQTGGRRHLAGVCAARVTITRSISICAFLCIVAPAALCASTDSPPPELTSFAYAKSHSVTPLPAPVVDRVADEAGPDDEARAYAPPVEARVEQPRQLSRSTVCSAVASVARANDLPVPFFANLIWQESSFNSRTVSPAGAQGIAQFMPKTAAEVGLMNPFEPIQALHAAGKFLSQLRAQFGNLGLAAAAYNAGPGRVIDWMTRRKSLPGETRNYVLRITGHPADRWTATDVRHDPEARLMPARAPCVEVAEAVAHQVKAVRVTRLMSELAAATASEPMRTALASKRDNGAMLVASAAPQGKRSPLKVASGASRSVREKQMPLAAKPAAGAATALAAQAAAKRALAKAAAAKPALRKAAAPIALASKAQKPAAKPALAHAHAPAKRTRVASAK